MGQGGRGWGPALREPRGQTQTTHTRVPLSSGSAVPDPDVGGGGPTLRSPAMSCGPRQQCPCAAPPVPHLLSCTQSRGRGTGWRGRLESCVPAQCKVKTRGLTPPARLNPAWARQGIASKTLRRQSVPPTFKHPWEWIQVSRASGSQAGLGGESPSHALKVRREALAPSPGPGGTGEGQCGTPERSTGWPGPEAASPGSLLHTSGARTSGGAGVGGARRSGWSRCALITAHLEAWRPALY